MLKDRILFVGIGQCGNNLVKQMEDLDYNVFYINTSYDDLKPLDTDGSKVYHIPNAKGCAKDRDKALNYAVGYWNDMANAIDSKFPTFDIVYFVYSLGGGTGGGISNILLDVISSKNPNKFYNVISVLPKDKESILVHSNARESLKQLVELEDKIYSIHLLDNNKSNEDDFSDINEEFAMLFDRFISFNETSVKGNIDEEELEKLATDSGISIIIEFDHEDFKQGLAEAINNSIYADWNTNCNYLGVILKDNNSKDKCLDIIEDNFGIPLADFTTFSNDSNLIIATGIEFNDSLTRKLGKLAKRKLQRKQELEAERLDDEEIEDDFDEEINIKEIIQPKTNKKKDKNSNKNNRKKVSLSELDSIIEKYRNK